MEETGQRGQRTERGQARIYINMQWSSNTVTIGWVNCKNIMADALKNQQNSQRILFAVCKLGVLSVVSRLLSLVTAHGVCPLLIIVHCSICCCTVLTVSSSHRRANSNIPGVSAATDIKVAAFIRSNTLRAANDPEP